MSFPEESSKNQFSTSQKDTNRKNMEIFKKDIKKLSYEESISQLETILTNVQDENISLNKIQDNYIKGNLLLKLIRNYHFGDVNIFWKDISENAKIRVENFYNLTKN